MALGAVITTLWTFIDDATVSTPIPQHSRPTPSRCRRSTREWGRSAPRFLAPPRAVAEALLTIDMLATTLQNIIVAMADVPEKGTDTEAEGVELLNRHLKAPDGRSIKPVREPVCPVCLLPYPWGDMSGWILPQQPCFDCLQAQKPPQNLADGATPRKD